MAKSFLNIHFYAKNIKKNLQKWGKMQKIWKFWFTKSGVWILKSLLYLQFLLHKKSVSREKFTKSREFTIFTFTKSGVDCSSLIIEVWAMPTLDMNESSWHINEGFLSCSYFSFTTFWKVLQNEKWPGQISIWNMPFLPSSNSCSVAKMV